MTVGRGRICQTRSVYVSQYASDNSGDRLKHDSFVVPRKNIWITQALVDSPFQEGIRVTWEASVQCRTAVCCAILCLIWKLYVLVAECNCLICLLLLLDVDTVESELIRDISLSTLYIRGFDFFCLSHS